MNSQKGVSLIITLFIMIIILSVVLYISALLYSEIRVIRNIGNAVVGLYAADSGIEKVLYYDWQVRPTTGDPVRGLCSMLKQKSQVSETDNPNACAQKGTDPLPDQSIFCNEQEDPKPVLNTGNPQGCNPDICDDCKIAFATDINDKISYSTNASVYKVTIGQPPEDYSRFVINSKGFYEGAGRQLQIVIDTKIEPQASPIPDNILPPSSIIIDNYYATCSSPKKIYATVSDSDGFNITSVMACYTDSQQNRNCLNLQSQGNDNWDKPWSPSDGKTYYIDITATNSDNKTNSVNFSQCCGSSC